VARALAAMVVAAPGVAWAQAAPALSWIPTHPLEGSLVSVAVAVAPADSLVPVTATLGEEPLHFERGPDGVFRALGAVALGGPDSALLDVRLQAGGGEPHRVAAWVAVARRPDARERLRTAPEFTETPDSALAARIALEQARMRAVYRRTHETPRLWHEAFRRPRVSAVRSAFGARRTVNGAEGGRHRGVDFAGAHGAPVRASNRGVVALVGDLFYSGRAVFVDHGAGLVTGYLHLSAVLVAEGDTVGPGQLVGRVGATGRVTGPHLHWLAHYGGTAVDPLDLPRLGPRPALAPSPAP
jgi:murein DD-endopeptidase MepM/ murein hydrolase activator NlpD